jgi:hypothetical protein
VLDDHGREPCSRWSGWTLTLEARELEVDLLDLGIAPGDIAGLALDRKRSIS